METEITKFNEKLELISLAKDKVSEIFNNSTIIQNETEDFEYFLNLFRSFKEFRLIYRGSESGFRAQNFHEQCDNKGPTITLIKDENNFIFGGYTSQNWKSFGGL